MNDPKTILVVDDEADLLVIIKTALKTEGYEVLTALSGTEAIQHCKEAKPDLLIVDLMMPGMDGFQTIESIRSIQGLSNVPTIMLTGVLDKDKVALALNSGINYYLIKPFEFHDFISKVKIAIQN